MGTLVAPGLIDPHGEVGLVAALQAEEETMRLGVAAHEVAKVKVQLVRMFAGLEGLLGQDGGTNGPDAGVVARHVIAEVLAEVIHEADAGRLQVAYLCGGSVCVGRGMRGEEESVCGRPRSSAVWGRVDALGHLPAAFKAALPLVSTVRRRGTATAMAMSKSTACCCTGARRQERRRRRPPPSGQERGGPHQCRQAGPRPRGARCT